MNSMDRWSYWAAVSNGEIVAIANSEEETWINSRGLRDWEGIYIVKTGRQVFHDYSRILRGSSAIKARKSFTWDRGVLVYVRNYA